MSESLKAIGVAYDNLTIAERDILSDPEKGMVIYNDDSSELEINQGSPAVPDWRALNTWDLANIAFLSIADGDDSTAERGNGNRPYRTFNAANADGASVIFIKDGSWGTETIVSNKIYYFFPGTQMFRLRDGGGTVTNTKILGYLKFRSNGYGLELTGAGSDIVMECDEFDNTRSIAFLYNGSTARITARKAFCNGLNGGAYSCLVLGTSTLELTITESATFYYWVVAAWGTSGNNIIFRCPDVRQIPGGFYGASGFSGIVSHAGSVTEGNTYLVDFMGGTLTRTRAQGNPITDSALISFANTFATQDLTRVKFQNGTVLAGPAYGLSIEFAVQHGHIELENLKIKSDTSPIRRFNRAQNGAGSWLNIIVKNCDLEGVFSCLTGNATIMTFINCNLRSELVPFNIDFNTSNPAAPGELYMINCNGVVDVPGEFLGPDFTAATVGLLNTYGNYANNGTVTDTWGGFTVVPTLTLPKIEI